MPDRVRRLPISPKGFPVPYFVAWTDGVPDFRVIRPGAIKECFEKKRCWICGDPLGRHLALVLGPMCAVNRVISEPAMHRDCATYSAIACPFLSNPRMRRHEDGLPEDRIEPPGIHLERNPGAVAVWITDRVWPISAPGGTLFKFGDPEQVLWYCQGRTATRAEVERSILDGLQPVEDMARSEGAEAMRALKAALQRVQQYLPQA